MDNFTYYAPTEILFGRDTEGKAGEQVKKWGGSRVLVVYGGQSAKQSGLLDRVMKSLEEAGLRAEEFGGAKPNPLLSHAEEGVKKALAMKADFILAVGGGSSIDTAKGIAHGTANPETPLWDIWTKKVPLTRSLPVGAILTIPAAGSEMSDSAVLTNQPLKKKAGLSTPLNRPKFAIMNPELATTLPYFQISCGITDIMMHTLERYFIPGAKARITDEIAEGLLRTVIDNGISLLQDRTDYEAMAEVMWAGSLSHNGLTECGHGRDFSVHKFGHALSAKYDVAHGASLSAVWGSWACYVVPYETARFAQYARSVWEVKEDNDELAALKGIKQTVSYFRHIGMPVSLAELGITVTEEDLDELADLTTLGDSIKLCTITPIGKAETKEILTMASEMVPVPKPAHHHHDQEEEQREIYIFPE